MLQPHRSPARSVFGSLVLIAVVGRCSCRRLRLHGGMVLASAPHAGQDGGCVHATHWRTTRPSQEPCQGNLLHRHLRIEWGRVGAFAGSGLHPRPIPGPRALQPRHRQSERVGCDGPGAGPGTADLNAGRAGMAHRHDRCPILSGVDAAGLLRAAARFGEQGPERDEDIRRRASRDRGVRRLGQ